MSNTSNILHQTVHHLRLWTRHICTAASECKHKIMASSQKRTPDSHAVKAEEPARSCTACTETIFPLIRPCRCASDYCVHCLEKMFKAATTDAGQMPPRCCQLLQIHTIIASLTLQDANAYRAKFEEWLAPTKTYCPSPHCSVFISERRMPAEGQQTASPIAATQSLSSLLEGVVQAVSDSPSARFFHDSSVSELPGYTIKVKQIMHLEIIRTNITTGVYQSSSQLTDDMRLIVANAKAYNGLDHPVTKTAEKLFDVYLAELSGVTDRLIATPPPSPAAVPPFFPCPECHIAICMECKQIEHSGSPCDTSAAEEEAAMLTKFGCKRCPKCKAGVKKMFGCSHIQCLCGAHWCYWCQLSIELCDGQCEARMEEDEELAESDSEDEGEVFAANATVADGNTASEAVASTDVTIGSPAEMRPLPTLAITMPVRQQSSPAMTVAPSQVSTTTPANENLDAGGERRWGLGEYDFGDEPQEDVYGQIWSCYHTFTTFKPPPDDGFDHGDLTRMECNRCFEKVETTMPPTKPVVVTRKRKRLPSSMVKEEKGVVPAPGKESYECAACHVLVCLRCKEKYQRELSRAED